MCSLPSHTHWVIIERNPLGVASRCWLEGLNPGPHRSRAMENIIPTLGVYILSNLLFLSLGFLNSFPYQNMLDNFKPYTRSCHDQQRCINHAKEERRGEGVPQGVVRYHPGLRGGGGGDNIYDITIGSAKLGSSMTLTQVAYLLHEILTSFHLHITFTANQSPFNIAT